MFGEISALTTAVLWSGSSLAFADATKRVGSFYVNMTRLLFAAVLLSLTVVVFRLDVFLKTSQFSYLIVSGMFGLVFGDTFLFRAYRYNSARITMLLMSASPAVAAVLAYFVLHERLSAWGILGIAVTLAGIFFVVLEQSGRSSVRMTISGAGLLYGFLAAIGQGAGLIFGKMAFNEGPINGFVAAAVRVVSATIILLPVAMMSRHYKKPLEVFRNDRRALRATIVGSILGPFLGITASLLAVAYTDVGIAATLIATVPIIMLPLVRVIYKERLSSKAVIGAFIAVAGVAILFLM
ncbi:MAG: DMT family transporter [Ignavibacteriales bacterium]|nr:DMT family transporter [Ignavibacteriales bacterium]